jgi:hypothetical protein
MKDQQQPIPPKAVQRPAGVSDSVEWLLQQYAAIIDRYHPVREHSQQDEV